MTAQTSSVRGLPSAVWVVIGLLMMLIVGRFLLALVELAWEINGRSVGLGIACTLILAAWCFTFATILKRKRFAWVFTRFASGLFGVWFAIAAVAGLAKGLPSGDLLLVIRALETLFYSVTRIVVFYVASQRSALAPFNLTCPRCGRGSTRPADFAVREMRCSNHRCRTVW